MFVSKMNSKWFDCSAIWAKKGLYFSCFNLSYLLYKKRGFFLNYYKFANVLLSCEDQRWELQGRSHGRLEVRG